MWAICRHLKKDRGVAENDESFIALPVGMIAARGKDSRGTQPYSIGKRHPCVRNYDVC
jgi:hypothetical protein